MKVCRESFAAVLGFLPVLAIGLFNVSCDLTEPPRFFNQEAKPPQVYPLDIANEIKPGQHLAGFFSFTVNLDSIRRPIELVILIVDSMRVSGTYGPPYMLTLNTYDWNEGPHLVAVGVVERAPNLGLLNLLGFPSVIFAAEVVFDQTPSTPVVLNPITWENGSPRLTWQQNNDANFYGYIIQRDGNYGAYPQFPLIYDRTTTTYLDTSITQTYGIDLNYRVDVYNRAMQAFGNSVNLQFGESLPASPFSGSSDGPRPLINPALDEMFIMSYSPFDTLKAVSTITHRIIRERSIPWFANFSISKDGARLFVVSYNPNTLHVLDAGTFDSFWTTNLNFNVVLGNAIVAGRSDRVYIADLFDANGVKIINAHTGAQVGQIPFAVQDALLTISPDNNTLYVTSKSAPATVYRIDITTDAPQILTSRTVDDGVLSMQINSDGGRLYVLPELFRPENVVEVWDAATLSTIGRLSVPFPQTDDRVFDVFVSASRVFVSFSRNVREGRYFLPGRVMQFDEPSMNALTSWDFVRVPRLIVASQDERYLYAFANKPCLVSIN